MDGKNGVCWDSLEPCNQMALNHAPQNNMQRMGLILKYFFLNF